MYQLLNNLFKKAKRTSTLLSIAGILTVVFIFLWINSTKVSANIWPIVVNVSYIDFGTVFPGETLESNFTVTYVENATGVDYRIIQRIKPLPDAQVPGGYEGTIDEYCQDNPDDLMRCYRNLCPFLEKVSVETEGDTEDNAFVGPDDTSDTWIIYFKVPAIFGYVGQDHIGGVVDSNGEYGCEVSIEILE